MLVGDFRDDRRIETVLLQGKTRLTRQLDRAREVPRQLVDGTGDDRSARPVVVDPDDQLPAGMPTLEDGQQRTEEGSGGEGGGRTCSSWGSAEHIKKKKE